MSHEREDVRAGVVSPRKHLLANLRKTRGEIVGSGRLTNARKEPVGALASRLSVPIGGRSVPRSEVHPERRWPRIEMSEWRRKSSQAWCGHQRDPIGGALQFLPPTVCDPQRPGVRQAPEPCTERAFHRHRLLIAGLVPFADTYSGAFFSHAVCHDTNPSPCRPFSPNLTIEMTILLDATG
ncbi:MAG: hypothetical protein ACRESR_07635 [Gammaproteobacteria bacterium]